MQQPIRNITKVSFQGSILKRGFWIYAWRINSGNRVVYYVGRTGDSSSIFASSPFIRMGRHLDLKKKAKGNSLARRLWEAKLNPEDCDFECLAFGPIFREQAQVGQHRIFRDRTAAIESFVACQLREHKHEVVGNHHCRTPILRSDELCIQEFLNNDFFKGKDEN